METFRTKEQSGGGEPARRGAMASAGPWWLFSPSRVLYYVADRDALRPLAELADVRLDSLEILVWLLWWWPN